MGSVFEEAIYEGNGRGRELIDGMASSVGEAEDDESGEVEAEDGESNEVEVSEPSEVHGSGEVHQPSEDHESSEIHQSSEVHESSKVEVGESDKVKGGEPDKVEVRESSNVGAGVPIGELVNDECRIIVARASLYLPSNQDSDLAAARLVIGVRDAFGYLPMTVAMERAMELEFWRKRINLKTVRPLVLSCFHGGGCDQKERVALEDGRVAASIPIDISM